ncbi:uncharacterized protein LOC128172335 [Crassostrea angulata]|uniref:uncharacterized protein LOC128172335 n=1 Tax=Magallana angulata TaxID=2784310 RepID=UPI0022B11AEA|nr:uncharacterized protein LOC128172335 [Crassostrea angulata]XP_052694092.1 uncharacterized protein LOC128172335 [Crassostrea angulata]
MEEGNRPCKRKRTDQEREGSPEIHRKSESHLDIQTSSSGSCGSGGLECGKLSGSCDCDKNRLNSNQNCSFSLSQSNCNKCTQGECNNSDGFCDCKRSCQERNINITSVTSHELSPSTADLPEKGASTSNSKTALQVLESLQFLNSTPLSLPVFKQDLVQCSSKLTASTSALPKTSTENSRLGKLDTASVSLQGSSKADLSADCDKASPLDTENSVDSNDLMNSDPKSPLDPLMNLCSCSNSGSPSQESVAYKVCNPGFEVLCSPSRNSSSNKSNEDHIKEVDVENGEETIRGGKQSSLHNEPSSVTDLITSRRATKFQIQRSLGESSENIRRTSWSLFHDQNNSADNVPNLNKKSDLVSEPVKSEGSLGSTLKLRFRGESSVKKEACPYVTSVSHINDLPPTILVYILRHLRMSELLHRASLVCKLWHQLVYDPDLWRRIDLKYQHKVTDTQLLTLTQISDRVTHIDISDTHNLTSEAVEHALKWCTHLRSLHMSRGYKLSDGVLEVVGQNCHRLQTLIMDGCYKITNNGLLKMAEGCPDLRKINLSRCSYRVTDDGVLAVAENCPRLREVILAYLSEVTDTSCVRLCEMCSDLEVVTLMFSGVSEKGVRSLTKLRKLKVLDISSLPGISPADVASLTQYCPDLEAMNVSLNPQIDDACLLQVVKYGRKLHLLQCVSCHVTDHFMSEVGKYTKTLKNLDIGWCQEVTDNGIRTLSATCQSLRYLGLIRCDAVTADAVEELVAKYPQITYSTFILESKKLIERARREGFMFNDDQVNMLV